jgi:maleylpyruvate isomerase
MYDSESQRAEEIAFGSTLPVEALRHLCAHAAVHLNVEWRDLPVDAWTYEVRTAQGRLVPAAETVWMRTREVWLHAVDLRVSGSVRDFPRDLIDLLLRDLIAVWRRKRRSDCPDIVLEPDDRAGTFRILPPGDDGDPLVVRGNAADLVAWGTGRRSFGVRTSDGHPPPQAPEWL